MQYPGGHWGQGLDVDRLSEVVAGHFDVIQVYPQPGAVGFEVEVEPEALEETFDALAVEMLGEGYTPYLLKDGEKHYVHVTWLKRGLAQNMILKVLLAILTVMTVGLAGMTLSLGYDDLEFGSWEAFVRGGVLFGAPLFLIVGIHELAHFLMARRYGTGVSLPILIPSVPLTGVTGITLTVLTFREPPRSRKALLDISVAGPLAGFIAALGLTILGAILTVLDPHHVDDDASATIVLGMPLIFGAIQYLVPIPDDVLVHPMVFAGWVGFILTFAVLIPIGGFDGGLATKAFFKERAKWVGALAIALLCSTSLITGYYGYVGTGIFLVILLLAWKAKPPLDEISPLPSNRKVLGIVVIVIMVLCFIPKPFSMAELEPDLEAEFEHPLLVMGPGEERENTLVLRNTGNTHLTVRLRLQSDRGWDVEFDENLSFPYGHSTWCEWFTVEKDRSTNHTTNISVLVGAPFDPHDSEVTLVVDVYYYGPGGDGETLQAEFTVEVSPPPE